MVNTFRTLARAIGNFDPLKCLNVTSSVTSNATHVASQILIYDCKRFNLRDVISCDKCGRASQINGINIVLIDDYTFASLCSTGYVNTIVNDAEWLTRYREPDVDGAGYYVCKQTTSVNISST